VLLYLLLCLPGCVAVFAIVCWRVHVLYLSSPSLVKVARLLHRSILQFFEVTKDWTATVQELCIFVKHVSKIILSIDIDCSSARQKNHVLKAPRVIVSEFCSLANALMPPQSSGGF
jgi:hypothetical protein